MEHKLGDVFEYVDGSIFLVGKYGEAHRLSFHHVWQAPEGAINITKLVEFEKRGPLFNLFEVLGKALGGEYAE